MSVTMVRFFFFVSHDDNEIFDLESYVNYLNRTLLPQSLAFDMLLR